MNALLVVLAMGATLDLGTISLQPNQAGQAVPLFVTGGDLVAGLNFNLETDGPAITDVDIVGTGTIFELNNTGQGGGSLLPELWAATTTTQTGTVIAEGTLAFVTFDTSGFGPGEYGLTGDTLNGPLELLNTGVQNVLLVEDGRLVLVPELSALALVLLSLCGLGFLRR